MMSGTDSGGHFESRDILIPKLEADSGRKLLAVFCDPSINSPAWILPPVYFSPLPHILYFLFPSAGSLVFFRSSVILSTNVVLRCMVA